MIHYYTIGGTYLLLSSVWFAKRWSTRWFGLYPFGITFYVFTPFLDRVGTVFAGFWQRLGYFAYRFFEVFFVVITSLLGYILLRLAVPLPMPGWLREVISYTFPLDILAFDDPIFLIILLLAFFIHEFFHGFVASSHDIIIENTGVFFIPNFIIAAYVKPDYEKWLKTKLDGKELEQELVQEYRLSQQDIDEYLNREETDKQPEREINTTSEDIHIIGVATSDYNNYVEYDSQNQSGEDIQDERHSDLKTFLISDPLQFRQEEIRLPVAHVASVGLFGNFLFLVMGIVIMNIPSLFALGDLIVKLNCLFISLNTLPIPLTDGGKVFHSKLIDFFGKVKGNQINHMINQFFLYLLLFFVIF